MIIEGQKCKTRISGFLWGRGKLQDVRWRLALPVHAHGRREPLHLFASTLAASRTVKVAAVVEVTSMAFHSTPHTEARTSSQTSLHPVREALAQCCVVNTCSAAQDSKMEISWRKNSIIKLFVDSGDGCNAFKKEKKKNGRRRRGNLERRTVHI